MGDRRKVPATTQATGEDDAEGSIALTRVVPSRRLLFFLLLDRSDEAPDLLDVEENRLRLLVAETEGAAALPHRDAEDRVAFVLADLGFFESLFWCFFRHEGGMVRGGDEGFGLLNMDRPKTG